MECRKETLSQRYCEIFHQKPPPTSLSVIPDCRGDCEHIAIIRIISIYNIFKYVYTIYFNNHNIYHNIDNNIELYQVNIYNHILLIYYETDKK